MICKVVPRLHYFHNLLLGLSEPVMSGSGFHILWVIFALCSCLSLVSCSMSYDSRALVVNGERRILISGSIHYPRSTPETWPDLIQKAKDEGLDVIQTYVFWNGHEPSPGKYYFEDRYDLVRFTKLVKVADLFVHLRIGPYVCAEWNFGGFPVWLKYVPGISFRIDNDPFKAAMEKFTKKIVGALVLIAFLWQLEQKSGKSITTKITVFLLSDGIDGLHFSCARKSESN